MKYDISNKSMNEIAEAIVLDYLGDKARTVKCIDIEGLLVDYFKLNVIYEQFAEDDPNKDGFIADGISPLRLWRNGKKVSVVFPVGTVVFDRYLLRPEQSCHRRFCLAHEAAHYVFSKNNIAVLGTFHNSFDKEYDYTAEQLREMFSFHEVQANAMGSGFLAPLFLTDRTFREFYPGQKKIKLYGDSTLLTEDRARFTDMADQMGVSKTTLLIKMKQYGMTQSASMDELVKEMKKRGGWGADAEQYSSEV